MKKEASHTSERHSTAPPSASFRLTSPADTDTIRNNPEVLLGDMFHAVSDLLAYKDAQGCYLTCNKAFLRCADMPERDIIGKFTSEIFTPESAEKLLLKDARALASGHALHDEDQVTFASGQRRWLEVTRIPRAHPQSGALGLMVVGRDVTERKKLEEALVLAQREAALAGQIRTNFLANISHEIRTPMNGILGLCFLTRGKACPPDVADYLLKIENSAKRLMEVLNDVLDFSLVGVGKVETEARVFSPHVLISETLAQLRPEAYSKNLAVFGELSPDLPVKLRGDAGRIQQILRNLGSNAVKFTRSGAVVISVTQKESQQGRLNVEFTVADTGMGMAPQTFPQLFQPFVQADTSTTRQFGGTGLGLSLCKSFTDLLGGTITVESAPGQGTTFVVTLPLEVPTESEKPAPQPHSLGALRGSRILLVEDNMINQLITREILEDKGAQVEVAENGVEALRMVARWPYDIILMDIQMPEMDGIECTRQLRQDKNMDTVPIIALSARTLEEEQALSREAGMQSHVKKPVDPVTLCDTVAHWISCRRNKQSVKDWR